jgi:hypothetical protein
MFSRERVSRLALHVELRERFLYIGNVWAVTALGMAFCGRAWYAIAAVIGQ